MREKLSKAGQAVICLAALLTLLACQKQVITVEIGGPSGPLRTGESVIQEAAISPQGVKGPIQYKWSVTDGSLSEDDTPSVEFTAPDRAGQVAVNVEVTIGETSFRANKTFQVVPPVAVAPPADTPAVTPIADTSMPSSHIIDTMDRTSNWMTSSCDSKCGGTNGASSVGIDSVSGRTNEAVEVSFDVKRDGWVIITRELNPRILSGTTGMSFVYKGSGASNTLELKLIVRYPGDDADTVFGVLWRGATNTDDQWKLLEVPYGDFTCWWPAPNCTRHGNTVDLTKVLTMDFAVSNRLQYRDEPGPGKIAFDDVVGLQQ